MDNIEHAISRLQDQIAALRGRVSEMEATNAGRARIYDRLDELDKAVAHDQQGLAGLEGRLNATDAALKDTNDRLGRADCDLQKRIQDVGIGLQNQVAALRGRVSELEAAAQTTPPAENETCNRNKPPTPHAILSKTLEKYTGLRYTQCDLVAYELLSDLNKHWIFVSRDPQ
jgi:chromosome segregation ATPase